MELHRQKLNSVLPCTVAVKPTRLALACQNIQYKGCQISSTVSLCRMTESDNFRILSFDKGEMDMFDNGFSLGCIQKQVN